MADAGSPDAVYALGVLAFQRRALDWARIYWECALQDGSCDAAYGLSCLNRIEGDEAAAYDALQQADDLGSASAALAVGLEASARGDVDAAHEALARAGARAREGDARGSADAANALGQVLAARGDLAGAEAAFRRADERGSGEAAYQVGAALAQRGDYAEADVAFHRAETRKVAAAALQRGVLQTLRGRPFAARRAWRRARRLAAENGDQAVFEAAERAMTQQRRTAASPLTLGLTIATAGVLALLVAANWRIVVAAGLAVAAPMLVAHLPSVDSPIAALTDFGLGRGQFEVGIAGLTIYCGEGWTESVDADSSKVMRLATRRDRRYFQVLPFVVVALSAAFAVTAANLVDSSVGVRAAEIAIGLVIVWGIAWSWPDITASETAKARRQRLSELPPWDEPGNRGAYVGAAFSVPFLRFHYTLGLSRGPLVSGVRNVLAWDRAQGRVAKALRRIEPGVAPATYFVLAVFLITLGVAPHPEPVLEATWVITSTVIEMGAVALGAIFCVSSARHAIRSRDLKGVAVSAVYLLVGAGLATVANALGLLDGWLSIFNWIADQV